MTVGFFGDYRASRRDERELGEGVWRRAHDRFKRGLDRYHQILESVRDPELRAAAVPVANELAELLPRVRAVCTEAHTRAPSQTQDIPHSTSGYLSDVHRQLSRAGNSMAQTAEALTMERFAAQGVPRAAAASCPRHDAARPAPAGAEPAAGSPLGSDAGPVSPEPAPTVPGAERGGAAETARPTAEPAAPGESPASGRSANPSLDSVRRRCAVVEDYVAAAEALMADHPQRPAAR